MFSKDIDIKAMWTHSMIDGCVENIKLLVNELPEIFDQNRQYYSKSKTLPSWSYKIVVCAINRDTFNSSYVLNLNAFSWGKKTNKGEIKPAVKIRLSMRTRGHRIKDLYRTYFVDAEGNFNTKALKNTLLGNWKEQLLATVDNQIIDEVVRKIDNCSLDMIVGYFKNKESKIEAEHFKNPFFNHSVKVQYKKSPLAWIESPRYVDKLNFHITGISYNEGIMMLRVLESMREKNNE